MLLFVEYRFKRLMNYATEVGTKRKQALVKGNCKDLQAMLDSTAHAVSVYHLHTKTIRGAFSSFIPWTNAYRARKECANLMDSTFVRLKKLETELKNLGIVNKQTIPNYLLTRSLSAPENPVLPLVYPSPLAAPRPQDDIDLHNKQRLADEIVTLNAPSSGR